MRKVKSFSVDDVEDEDILKKLDSCSNVSDYIKRLIREDLEKKDVAFSNEQIEVIKDIVNKIIKGKQIVVAEEEKDEMDEAVNDILNSPAAMSALMQYTNPIS